MERDDDEIKWNMNNIEGLDRSSHDEGFTFENFNKTEENIQLNKSNIELEEIESKSSNDDDERLIIDENRISFTREQHLEYQQIIKLLRLIKNGGRCLTLLSLIFLRDHNLQDQCAYFAFLDCSIINVLLNSIEISDRDLKINTLNVLKDACQNSLFAYEIFRLGGMITIIESLEFDQIGIEESCMILLKILSFHRARRVIRRSGGIEKLINLLDELTENIIENKKNIIDLFEVFLLICKTEINKYIFIQYGISRIILDILSKIFSQSIINFLSILLEIDIFRLQMMNKNLILTLIHLIDMKNIELTRVICECLYYLSLDSNFHQFISENYLKIFENLFEENLDPLILCFILNISKEFLKKKSHIFENILKTILQFIRISTDKFYLSRIFQSLKQLIQYSQTIELFKQENIYPNLLIHLSNSNIQYHLLFIFEQCAKDRSSARIIVENNGLQQFWSIFKLNSLNNQISAGWTIRNCLASIENHGELIRSFDGIFYLIFNILSTDNLQLLSVTLAIIAEIVKDQYNLQILTELGVARKISQLNQLENHELRRSFCDVMSNLLNLPENQKQFGNHRVLTIIKTYLNDYDEQLYPSLTKSIYDLSLNHSNCIILHEIGITFDLLRLIGNNENFVQENAANALRNIRRLFNGNKEKNNEIL